ncbi:biotin/lipoyl-binding protein, partial [Escherichia coli]
MDATQARAQADGLFAQYLAALASLARLMVAGSRKAVQHPTGGLVRHIRVHEGERVEAGQVLLEMDATQARAQADGLFAQYLAALASLARL